MKPNEDARERVDLIVCGARELATPRGFEACRGADLARLDVIPEGAVAIHEGRIEAVGGEREIVARYQARATLDANGGTIIPGFVDAHTHPLFFGTREDEFELRTKGASYVEIAQAGGGIVSSVRGVREASHEDLLALLLIRLDRFAQMGTTTIEAKSGYALSVDDELKCLRVIEEANRIHEVRLVPTFLGAHDFPPEYRDDRNAYIELLIESMLPEVAASGLAEYCDIFTEEHVFGLDDTRRILTRARDLGMKLRLHVDQLTALGGAQLAAELGASSADHLEFVSNTGIDALARANVIPVLCPLVPLVLRVDQEVPARRMIEAGLAPALATDFNPGSCNTQSMPEVLTWAALRLRMTVEECLVAATLNAAASLDRADEIGSLDTGKRADVVVLDVPSHKHLCYEFGRNPVRAVVCGGKVVGRLACDATNAAELA